ncbi:hypothetical protein, partial [Aeromonas sp. QDB04]|uniref:hypothetical protein n=2 Tax=unclassified Aeromonas TaxID=257493 RepID=UPI003FA41F6F
MESLNQTLFLWLNAPEHPSALALTLAVFFAERLIWAVPLVIPACRLEQFPPLCIRHSAPDLGINLPIALTQYLQNDLLV